MIAIVLRDYGAAIYAIVEFYLFYDWAVDMQIHVHVLALLTDHCRVSDTQVTVKACGPLVQVQK